MVPKPLRHLINMTDTITDFWATVWQAWYETVYMRVDNPFQLGKDWGSEVSLTDSTWSEWHEEDAFDDSLMWFYDYEV